MFVSPRPATLTRAVARPCPVAATTRSVQPSTTARETPSTVLTGARTPTMVSRGPMRFIAACLTAAVLPCALPAAGLSARAPLRPHPSPSLAVGYGSERALRAALARQPGDLLRVVPAL